MDAKPTPMKSRLTALEDQVQNVLDTVSANGEQSKNDRHKLRDELAATLMRADVDAERLRAELATQQALGEARFQTIETKLDNHIAVTSEMNESVKTVAEILALSRGFFKVLGVIGDALIQIGKVAGALAVIGGALGGLWYAITHGGKFP